MFTYHSVYHVSLIENTLNITFTDDVVVSDVMNGKKILYMLVLSIYAELNHVELEIYDSVSTFCLLKNISHFSSSYFFNEMPSELIRLFVIIR